MSIYKISNMHSGKCLNIYGDNVTSLRNNQNVCQWSSSDTNEQKWEISALGKGVYIKSVINTSFGLNVYRSGSPWNCDVYPISGNETDAKINIIPSSTQGYYKIQLANHTDYYLTAGGTGDGANVYWSTSGGYNQLWSFYKYPDTPSSTSKSLSMPQNLNQRYSGNDSVIQSAGCCVCCACDVASYYKGSCYTLLQMRNVGVYSISDPVCYWGNVPSASFSDYTGQSQSGYFSKIRSEIDAGRPVLVYMTGKYEHWVVAYGYKNGGASNDNILVLDPYGSNTSTAVGRNITLAEAMSTQVASTINKLVTTRAK